MKTWSHWSPVDIEQLRGLYSNPHITLQDIAKTLGRTPSAIRGKAFSLKFQRPSSSWTIKEDQKLCILYPTMQYYKDIVNQFPNRTVDALIARVKKLKLTRKPRGKQSLLPILPTESAYIAGLTDGEGTISLRTSRNITRKKQLAISPYIAIYNSDTCVLQWLQEITGIGYNRKRHANSFTRKPIHEWTIKGLINSARFLRTIFPYLKIKRQQAQLVLNFCEGRILYTEYTTDELEMITKIRKLNKRGL